MKNNLIRDNFLSEILKKDCFWVLDIEKQIKFKPNSFYQFRTIHNPKLIDLALSKNFKYINGQLILGTIPGEIKVKELPKEFKISKNVDIVKTHDLNNLAKTISNESRFMMDSRIKKYAIKIYENWLHNSLLENYAADYLLALTQNKVVGVCTLVKERNVIRIDLMGINKKYQNKGVGSILLNNILNKYPGEKIYVGTQTENIGAINFYIKNGFKPFSYKLIFHKTT